ncbi:MAG: DUF4404 family protein [Thermostichales cyanobacterium BF4_bins_65]
MDKQELIKELEQLHQELQHVTSLDPQERSLLAQVALDIRHLLEAERHQELISLGHRMDQLAAAYPRASLLMGKIANALANMGL